MLWEVLKIYFNWKAPKRTTCCRESYPCPGNPSIKLQRSIKMKPQPFWYCWDAILIANNFI